MVHKIVIILTAAGLLISNGCWLLLSIWSRVFEMLLLGGWDPAVYGLFPILALWGMVTGVGLIYRWTWAYASTLIYAILISVYGLTGVANTLGLVPAYRIWHDTWTPHGTLAVLWSVIGILELGFFAHPAVRAEFEKDRVKSKKVGQ